MLKAHFKSQRAARSVCEKSLRARFEALEELRSCREELEARSTRVATFEEQQEVECRALERGFEGRLSGLREESEALQEELRLAASKATREAETLTLPNICSITVN